MRKDVKDLINKRKIAYVYLLHRMFESSPALLLKVMKIPNVTIEDIQDWDRDYKDAVYDTIREEDARGVALKDPHEEVPSIKGIKEKVLRRVDQIIQETTDPARLATTYKVLSEFEAADDRKDRSVLDAINDIVKPKHPRQKETKTLLDKMRDRGSLAGKDAEPDATEGDGEEEETINEQ